MRLEIVEQHARSLIEHVGVEAVGLSSRTRCSRRRAPCFSSSQFGVQLGELRSSACMAQQPMVAGEGMEAEIGDAPTAQPACRAPSVVRNVRSLSPRDHGGNNASDHALMAALPNLRAAVAGWLSATPSAPPCRR